MLSRQCRTVSSPGFGGLRLSFNSSTFEKTNAFTSGEHFASPSVGKTRTDMVSSRPSLLMYNCLPNTTLEDESPSITAGLRDS